MKFVCNFSCFFDFIHICSYEGHEGHGRLMSDMKNMSNIKKMSDMKHNEDMGKTEDMKDTNGWLTTGGITTERLTTEAVRERIFSMADEKYREFHTCLVPGEDNIVGVRVPVLRKYAGELYGAWTGDLPELLELIGDEYYEEIMLQGMIIGMAKVKASGTVSRSSKPVISIDELFSLIEKFAPKINNWAICDVFCAGLKQVRKYPEETYAFLGKYLRSEGEFEIRFGLVMLLDHYIDEEHLQSIFEICEAVSRHQMEAAEKRSIHGEGSIGKTAADACDGHDSAAVKGKDREEGYYVKMAVAWLISICFVKFYDETKAFMEECSLDDRTYNKAIQKALESFRLSEEQKNRLRLMKKRIFQAKTLDTC